MDDDFRRNRLAWDAESDAYQARHSAQLAAANDAWGIWSIPERDLNVLGDIAGRDVLELGCGAAQWSIALAKRGARVTALDNSSQQLEHARDAVEAAGVAVKLVHAPAERTPFGDAIFDVVFSDHGAMSFASPVRTVPEAARLLRPGGILAFNVEHPLHAACWDDAASAPSRALHHAYFELDRIDDPEDGGVNYALPVSAYAQLLRAHGFAIELLLEPRPQAGATTSYEGFAPHAWARDFPAELLVRARKAR